LSDIKTTQTLRRLPFAPGVTFMVLSAASFCMMTVFVKLAGYALPTIQIVFVRGLFTLVITGFFLYRDKIEPFGNNRKLLVARGITGTIALFLVYESIKRFPLSEATNSISLSIIYSDYCLSFNI